MRTLMLAVSFGLLLSGSVSNAGGGHNHDHGPKTSGAGYPNCTIHFCPPAYPSYGYRPYYRTNRRFSVQVSWAGAYGGYGGFGFGVGGGYGAYGFGYGYRPYNPYPTFRSHFSGVTYLPFGSVMYY